MLQTKTTAKVREIQFSDADVVNPQDFIPAGLPNLQEIKPWLFHDHGFVLAIVFASNLQKALDLAADEGKLKGMALREQEVADHYTTDEGHECCERCGNASEPYDLQNLEWFELSTPPFSFVALYNAVQG